MAYGIDLGKSPWRRTGWFALLAVLAAVVTTGLVTAPSGAGALYAQENENGGEEAEEAPQDAEPAATDETAGGETQAEDVPEERNFLSWMIEASGIFGLVLLLMSFVMVALIVMNILQVRRDQMLPPDFIEAFEQKLAAKDYQAAYETARSDDSFVARVLAAGLSKLNRGYGEAIEGMQEVGEDESMHLEHRLSYLALIGSIAPMVGLMGTVWGMIDSFQKIATSTQAPPPSELADGISTALFTTLEGLTVAIPAMIAYGMLRNRVARFVLEVGMVSEGLMSRFSTVGKSRPSGGAAPATSPAAPKD